jgi:hypothetical protein
MPKDQKFGYGFLFVGAGMPYLIDKFFGPLPAAVVSIILFVVGILFLISAHLHRDKDAPPRGVRYRYANMVVILLLIVVSMGGIIWAITKHYRERSETLDGNIATMESPRSANHAGASKESEPLAQTPQSGTAFHQLNRSTQKTEQVPIRIVWNQFFGWIGEKSQITVVISFQNVSNKTVKFKWRAAIYIDGILGRLPDQRKAFEETIWNDFERNPSKHPEAELPMPPTPGFSIVSQLVKSDEPLSSGEVDLIKRGARIYIIGTAKRGVTNMIKHCVCAQYLDGLDKAPRLSDCERSKNNAN